MNPTDHNATTVEFLGHAGLAVRHGGKLLLCDPWMAPHGAYNASWFQYPAYPHTDLSALLEPDAVYVSHEHADHYDPWFLAQLSKDVPILTGRFHKRLVVRKLEDLGFRRIVELGDFAAYPVADDFVVEVCVPSYNCPPHWFDSCAMIRAGGFNIFNLNDANPALQLEPLREQGIDVLLGQASPAIWYPITYTNYTEEQKVGLRAARRESAIDSFAKIVQALQPKLAIPFAGPPMFFDDQLAEHTLESGSMFGTAPVAAERVRQTTKIPAEVLKPGDVLRLGHDRCTIERTPDYESFDYERDRRAYFEAHKQEKQRLVAATLAAIPEAAPGLFDRFRRHMRPLLKRNPFFIARVNMRVLFDVRGPHGGKWVVDFRDVAHEELVYEWHGESCQYQFEFEARNVDQVLRGEMSWEDLLLSLRFRARRDPDRYNQHLFTFLKMADDAALQAIVKAEIALRGAPEDIFTLDANGESYEVQRFCPHAGSDLSEAAVVDGQLVCPGHRWHFDLATGACAESDYKILCRKLVAAKAAGGSKTPA